MTTASGPASAARSTAARRVSGACVVAGARRRSRGRDPVHGQRVRPRPRPRRQPRRQVRAARRPTPARVRRRARAGAAVDPFRGPGAPRPEAGERAVRPARAEGHRLRYRVGGRRSLADPHRAGRRHHRLDGAGAGERREGAAAHRHLLLGVGDLLRRDGPAAVRRGHARRRALPRRRQRSRPVEPADRAAAASPAGRRLPQGSAQPSGRPGPAGLPAAQPRARSPRTRRRSSHQALGDRPRRPPVRTPGWQQPQRPSPRRRSSSTRCRRTLRAAAGAGLQPAATRSTRRPRRRRSAAGLPGRLPPAGPALSVGAAASAHAAAAALEAGRFR